MKKTTLGEHGQNLPTGKVAGGTFVREFALREFNFGIDRQIAKVREAQDGMAVSAITSLVLSRLVTKLHGQECDPAKPEESKALLYKCSVGDVMYMWLWARFEAMGEALEIPFQCQMPSCLHKDPELKFDMRGMDVFVAEGEDQLQGTVKLSRPYTVRKEQITELKVKPPLWSIFSQAGGASFNYQGAVFQSSVYGTDKHETIVLGEPELDQLSRKDYKALAKEIDRVSPGPRLVIEGKCPKCEGDFKQMLDWDYDTFFE